MLRNANLKKSDHRTCHNIHLNNKKTYFAKLQGKEKIPRKECVVKPFRGH